MKTREERLHEFTAYCFGYYGYQGVFAQDFFGGFDYLTVEAAANLIMLTAPNFEGDSVDRERVRRVLEATPAYQNTMMGVDL